MRATLPEIRPMARMTGPGVGSVNEPYSGEEYSARSRETLVVLEGR